jgi:ATP-dependent Clp protease, protease subunit
MGEDQPGMPALAGGGRDQVSDLLAERLRAQRVVLLHGVLDDLTLTRVSAELMTFDAEGDEPVTLRVDCGEAELGPALTLMDVVELMGVPVRALCLGQVGAGAVGVVAVCATRAAMPSTRFALREPSGGRATVHARNVAQWAELRALDRERFCTRVAAAVRQPAEQVGRDLTRGCFFGAAEAVEYGLVDEVCRPDAAIHSLPGSGSPMGFRPVR